MDFIFKNNSFQSVENHLITNETNQRVYDQKRFLGGIKDLL